MQTPYACTNPVKIPDEILNPEDPTQTCLHMTLEKDDKTITENLFFYLPDKFIDFPQMQIKSEISQSAQNSYELKLTSDSVTKDVYIEPIQNTAFSDNFFDLMPGRQKSVTIESSLTLDQLKTTLNFTALNSLTQ